MMPTGSDNNKDCLIGREKSLNVLGSWLDEEKLITRKRRKGRCKRRIKFKKKTFWGASTSSLFRVSIRISALDWNLGNISGHFANMVLGIQNAPLILFPVKVHAEKDRAGGQRLRGGNLMLAGKPCLCLNQAISCLCLNPAISCVCLNPALSCLCFNPAIFSDAPASPELMIVTR